jgi:hypothetical protein
MSTILFIVMCVLAIINIILYTFVASAIHKRDLCQKSPYYHCDTDWICCMANQTNCDTAGVKIGTNAYYITDQIYGTGASGGSSSSAGGSTKGLKDSSSGGTDKRGLQILDCDGTYGTYYELCVLPVQNVIKKYKGASAPDLACLYDKTAICPPAENDPSVTIANPSVGNFTPGQCCYQKFDPDLNGTNLATAQNLYPNTASPSSWNSNGLYANNYTNSTDFTFPQGSNNNTQNNSCNNSFYSHSNAYNNCPPLPS